MRFSSKQILSIVAATSIVFSCCKRDDEDPEDENQPAAVVVPETYSFENVSFSGQTDRLNQMEEMTKYIKSAHVDGVELDIDALTAMWENTGDNGDGNFSFSSSKQLKNKCFELDQPLIEGYLKMGADASKSTVPGENGVAGRVTSSDGSQSRLYDENGWEPAQLVEKTIMGAVFYYQATTIYMGDDRMNVDNATVEEGKGTEMQHHWDEAYGYFGATVDFPKDTENVRFWANYCNGRDPLLNSNEKLSEALRRGRASINANRIDERDEAIADARAEWENVVAATAIHYLNGSLANLSDDYVRNHELSEAWAFITSLKYNEEKTISNAEIDELHDMIGTNFYEVTSTGLTSARDKLASMFDLEDVKTSL